MSRLYLASQSPRRRELLSASGIPFTLVDGTIDEDLPVPPRPDLLAVTLATLKALAGGNRVESGWVLGADTIVVIEDRVLGKPRNLAEAHEMLRTLGGRTHRVITGVALLDAARGDLRCARDVTHVTMRAVTEDEIVAYGASREWEGKAGGYAIQETADRFVIDLEGSYSNVVGLPMERVTTMLAAAGFPTSER
ncbi:MAG TPA: Maf family protein [Planctomycetota bacterium]|nr:Maf family protein [Planctomycetota bacterium]